jgi:hypothetical protein
MTVKQFFEYLVGHPSTTGLGEQLALAYVQSEPIERPLAARSA